MKHINAALYKTTHRHNLGMHREGDIRDIQLVNIAQTEFSLTFEPAHMRRPPSRKHHAVVRQEQMELGFLSPVSLHA